MRAVAVREIKMRLLIIGLRRRKSQLSKRKKRTSAKIPKTRPAAQGKTGGSKGLTPLLKSRIKETTAVEILIREGLRNVGWEKNGRKRGAVIEAVPSRGKQGVLSGCNLASPEGSSGNKKNDNLEALGNRKPALRPQSPGGRLAYLDIKSLCIKGPERERKNL